jgi:hypothetical protein
MARKLDEFILARIQERLNQPERLAGIIKALEREVGQRYGNAKGAVETLEARLKAIRDQEDRILDTVDPSHREAINRNLTALQQERETLENQRSQLLSRPKLIDPQRLARELAEQVKQFERVMRQAPMPERKVFVQGYVARITVDTSREEATAVFYRWPRLPSLDAATEFISASRTPGKSLLSRRCGPRALRAGR